MNQETKGDKADGDVPVQSAVSTLRRIPIFSGLSEEEGRALLATCKAVTYPAGQTIFEENMPGDEVYLILEGCVAVTTQERSRTKVLNLLKAGEFLGEMAVVETETRDATAVVHEDVKLIVITSRNFLDFVSGNTDVMMRLIRALCHRLREANDEIRNFTFHSQAGRLAKTLLALSSKFGTDRDGRRVIDVRLTHQDLADVLGIARESVTRLLGDMKRDGAIEMKKQEITIIDAERLATWIS